MNRIIYSIIALTVLFTLNACEKQLQDYQGKSNIYFNETARPLKFQGEVLIDSAVLSFALLTGNVVAQPIIVAASGPLSSEDREYKLVVDPASTAIAGMHYTQLPATFTIKKNRFTDTIFVTMHRTPDLLTNGVQLFLNLEPNENFATEMKSKVINAATGKKLSYIQYRIFLSDILKKPARWLDGNFGVFTRKKLFLMCEVLNITPAYIDATISVAESTAFGKVMQRYLIDQRLDGKTVYEEDGTEMIMGPSSQ